MTSTQINNYKLNTTLKHFLRREKKIYHVNLWQAKEQSQITIGGKWTNVITNNHLNARTP